MAFHLSIAWRAHLSGKKAAEFEAATYRHAKAFWFYMITAAIVWWFTSWHWALIPVALGAWCAVSGISAGLVQLHMEKLEKNLADYEAAHPGLPAADVKRA